LGSGTQVTSLPSLLGQVVDPALQSLRQASASVAVWHPPLQAHASQQHYPLLPCLPGRVIKQRSCGQYSSAERRQADRGQHSLSALPQPGLARHAHKISESRVLAAGRLAGEGAERAALGEELIVQAPPVSLDGHRHLSPRPQCNGVCQRETAGSAYPTVHECVPHGATSVVGGAGRGGHGQTPLPCSSTGCTPVPACPCRQQHRPLTWLVLGWNSGDTSRCTEGGSVGIVVPGGTGNATNFGTSPQGPPLLQILKLPARQGRGRTQGQPGVSGALEGVWREGAGCWAGAG
jgi:hypothetical protein